MKLEMSIKYTQRYLNGLGILDSIDIKYQNLPIVQTGMLLLYIMLKILPFAFL